MSLPDVVLQAFYAYDQLRDAVYLIDPASGRILLSNRSGCQQLGLSQAQLSQQTVFSLQRDVVDLEHWHAIVAAIREVPDYIFCGRHVRADGSEFSVEVLSHLVTWGGQEYLLSQVRDLQRRDAVEQQLRSREPLLNFALNEATDGMWDWNIATNDVFFSPQLKRMLGYGPYEMKPQLSSWENSLHPHDHPHVMEAIRAHIHGQCSAYQAEYRIATRNGQYLWVRDRGRVCLTDDEGRALRMVGMVLDISEQKQLEQRLLALASHDDLTGLLNRRAGYDQFEQQLQLAGRYHTPLSVALLDIDHFKRINDQYGHQQGDQVLQRVAELLTSRLRRTDILMRWGGEEFLLLMPHTHLMDGHHLCQQLCQQLADEHWSHSAEAVTLSIGLTSVQPGGGNIAELVHHADQALYRAKAAGRNRIVVAE
ncbi:hypothetical protein GCM10011297_16750 [Bacterioplanes sanyensis]|uniref:sensor domain-containing diguanylate cyclase n=1 Tax=Bacterioplanes sanyensis TaxID=1249553 RepID=UPI0016780543|nr:sensor domain-containing diguanylate cyclase [Bacterioplanes sanyensis]GGY44440.1 hypothetical protein GCM10011297_16750 [Bacterioplanes sanyensis]